MTTSYLVYVMIEVFLQQMACHWKSDWEFKIKEYIFYFIRRIFFMISLNLVSTSLCPVKCVCTAATVKDCPRHLKNTRNLSSFWFLLGIFWCFYIYIYLIFQKNKEMLWSKHFAIQRRKLNKNRESSSFPCKLQFAIPTAESCGFGFLSCWRYSFSCLFVATIGMEAIAISHIDSGSWETIREEKEGDDQWEKKKAGVYTQWSEKLSVMGKKTRKGL